MLDRGLFVFQRFGVLGFTVLGFRVLGFYNFKLITIPIKMKR
jgi:hypothetical protein